MNKTLMIFAMLLFLPSCEWLGSNSTEGQWGAKNAINNGDTVALVDTFHPDFKPLMSESNDFIDRIKLEFGNISFIQFGDIHEITVPVSSLGEFETAKFSSSVIYRYHIRGENNKEGVMIVVFCEEGNSNICLIYINVE